MSARRGMTLIELLIALVVLGVLMGAALSLFLNQQRQFDRTGRRLDALHQQRYALATVERVVRTAGAHLADGQPALVYGGGDVVAINADYSERTDSVGRWAVNLNPDAPVATTVAWALEDRAVLPNTSYTYPPRTYRVGPDGATGALAPAETVIFWFTADAGTARTDDFVLMQRANNGAADVVARGIRAYPGRPFFEYLVRRQQPDSLFVAPADWLPLIRRDLAGATTAADSATFTRADSVAAIRLNLRIATAATATGGTERTQDLSTLIKLPNNGLLQVSTCGRAPVPPGTPTVTAGAVGSGTLTLRWTVSPDQNGGERDIRQYVVYQRDDTATVWRQPLVTLRADTATTRQLTIAGLVSSRVYRFGIAAQDCTPRNSAIASIAATAP